jgi:hypothetical protein
MLGIISCGCVKGNEVKVINAKSNILTIHSSQTTRANGNQKCKILQKKSLLHMIFFERLFGNKKQKMDEPNILFSLFLVACFSILPFIAKLISYSNFSKKLNDLHQHVIPLVLYQDVGPSLDFIFGLKENT